MSLRDTITVKRGSTPSLTGGTDVTFINNGRGTNGANVLVDTGNADLTTREKIITTVTDPAPAPNASANATLGRRTYTRHHPEVHDGKQYKKPSQYSIAVHHTDTEAEILARINDDIAWLQDPETQTFLVKGVNA